MRISIAATMLILAVGAGLGWYDRQQLAAYQTTRRQLAAEAATLGIAADPAQSPTRATKHKRPDRATAAKPTAAGLIELTKQMELLNTPGGQNYHAANALHLRILDSLAALDPAELKTVLAEISCNPDLTSGARYLLRSSCTTVLANDHPQAALEIFTRSPELFAESCFNLSVVCTALARWAKDDPMAALDWVRQHPQQATDFAKHGMFSAVAEQDPHLAFRLISELGFSGSNQAVYEIMDSAKTPEQMTAALTGLRESLATIQDGEIRNQVVESALSGLARQLDRAGFESATRWIAEAGFTPQELAHLVDGLYVSTSNGETGRWIEWLRQALPAKVADSKIRTAIDNWARADYQAAAQWAMTQRPGKDRDQTLTTIHDYWPKQDPAGKAAFEKQYDIK
jgi:hypothetical protein